MHIEGFPEAAFDALAPIRPKERPGAWRAAHEAWTKRERNAGNLREAFTKWGEARSTETGMCFNDVDAISAAVLLFVEGANSDLGRAFFATAMTNCFAAFVAGHLTSLTCDQEEQILETLHAEPDYLFWLGCSRPTLRDACCVLASLCGGIFSALAVTQTDDQTWFEQLIETAGCNPEDSSTALILYPKAPTELRRSWIANVRSAPGLAYETARWTMRTWPGGQWLALRDALRDAAISDGGCWWFHWWRDNQAPIDHSFPIADPLWSFELMLHLCIPQFSAKFEEHLRSLHLANPNNQEASILLRWCQTHRKS